MSTGKFRLDPGVRCVLALSSVVALLRPPVIWAAPPSCSWQSGFSAGLDGTVETLAVFDDGSGPALYVGGEFSFAGGTQVNHIAKWDGATWSALSGPSGTGTDAGVTSLAVFDDGKGPALYAGGRFASAGGLTAAYVLAKWDGSSWSPVSGPSGTQMNNFVFSLAVYDDGSGPALYVGGSFTTAGGLTANHIVKWDGTTWSALSGPIENGVDSFVLALTVFDDGRSPALFAGGGFPQAGGITVNQIAKWDGISWAPLAVPLGTGVDSFVFALAVFDDGGGPALYAGGSFTTAGGISANQLARWDGLAWSPLSGLPWLGANDIVYALGVFDDGLGPALHAAGLFTEIGEVAANRIAQWDGSSWSALSGPTGNGMDGQVLALAAFDDSAGPALYAGGDFLSAGGLSATRIAKRLCVDSSPPRVALVDSVASSQGSLTEAEVVNVAISDLLLHFDERMSPTLAADLANYRLSEAGANGTLDTTGCLLAGDDVQVGFSAVSYAALTTTLTVPGAGPLSDGLYALAACSGLADPAGNHLDGDADGTAGDDFVRTFRVDRTAPSSPSGLASPSHALGTPSGDATVEVRWTASTDDGSGIAGYAWSFSGSSMDGCDEVVDGAATLAISPVLADGTWWFHVCAVDGGGNPSAAASLGPFVIDSSAPIFADGFESGDTSGWSLALP